MTIMKMYTMEKKRNGINGSNQPKVVLAAQLAQLDALPTERSAALPAAGPRRTPPPFQNVLAVERHWLLHPQTILSVRRFLVSVGS